MAAAWGKLTGRPGIAFVTRGPGAANAAIGVHTARQDSSPMILFVGQVATSMRDREAFQEVEYRAVFGSLAKWAVEIDDAGHFLVEDRPDDGSLDLLGLYDGWALTERDRYGVGELPDRIIVYRESHLAACADEDELRDEIHTTLVHEIAHFYGIDDDRLHELGWA